MFEAYIRKRFKANSTPFDISATSAFKPTKPLDIRNGSQQQQQQQQQQPLISPITGQPLSHVPAPLLLSSSTNSGAGASFRLARSSTQPLQSPRVVHLAAQGQGSATPPSSIARQQSINDNSLSEQLTLSVGNDTERIFDMSGLDDDSAIQSLGDNASSTTPATATATTTTAQSTGGAGVGVARSSSVRARANMFQQLQQQELSNRSRRETTGGETLPLSQSRSFANRQATSRHSPPPSASLGSPSNDEPSTPNTTQDATDADFEPSSLSLAERLAFFSSLCESSGGATTPTTSAPSGGRFSSRASSCASSSRSPPYNSMERTPFVGNSSSNSSSSSSNMNSSSSSNNTCNSSSSNNVTPTPMECTPSLQQEAVEELPTSPPQQEEEQQMELEQHNGFVELRRSATAPLAATTAATATTAAATVAMDTTTITAPITTRRLKLRTVGKLVLPDTFLSDRNNNNKHNNNNNNNNHRNSCMARIQTLEDIHISMGVRTIGKIKSPFIEQQQQKEQQQQQQQQQLKQDNKSMKLDYKSLPSSNNHNDSSDDAQSSDSGKENCAANQQKQQQQQQQQQQLQQQQQKLPQTVSTLATATVVNRRHTTELGGSVSATATCGINKNRSSGHVDERYAKYFGLNESYNTTTTTTLHKTPEAHNEHVRLPAQLATNGSSVSLVQKRRELLKRTRAMSLETTGSGSGSGSVSVASTSSLKRAHSPVCGNRGKLCVASFEDIVVTPDELHAAGSEFKRLCGEILGT
ncbi:hypothetical protein ACLKA7_017035 [Drosophila subpalustris]